jgi:hypothetical protein
MRFLDRLGRHPDVLEVEEVALEGDGLAGKGAVDGSNSCTAFAISASGIGLIDPDPGKERNVSRHAAIGIAACSRQDNRPDRTRIVVLQFVMWGPTGQQIMPSER